ncbi:MAG: glycosyltransferase, partial [Lachnospiraceae bacterium]
NKAKGNMVTLMDVDLQDPPFMLKEMYKSIKEEGFEQVGTRRVTRKGEPKIRSFFARCFYKLINRMSDVEMVDGARDYRLMTRKVVDAILSMKEYNRYSKGIFSFVGFKTKWLEYENVERAVGETKWSFWSLFKYAIKGIVAFTTTPLVISSVFGILMMFLALIFIVIIIVRTLAFGDPTSGWPSMVCIILFVSGVQLFFLGVIGQYLANTYQEVKKRPLYFISEEGDSDEK